MTGFFASVQSGVWIKCAQGVRQAECLMHEPFLPRVNEKLLGEATFVERQAQSVVRLSTSRGFDVALPLDRQVLVQIRRRQKFGGGYNVDREWRSVRNLQPEDQLVLDDASAIPLRRLDDHFEKGWLLGCIVGDGGHNPIKYPSYARFWGPYAEVRARRAARVVGLLDQSFFSPRSFRGAYFNSHHDTWQVASRRIDHFLDGLIEPRTKAGTPLLVVGARRKSPICRTHKCLFLLQVLVTEGCVDRVRFVRFYPLETKSAAFIAGFLQGLFDTDGSVQGSTEKGVSVRLGQSDLDRLKLVQRMLLCSGIVSTIYANRRPAGTSWLPDGRGGSKEYDVRAQHELVIASSNLRVFQNKIGFSQPEKHNKLQLSFQGRKRKLNTEPFVTKLIGISNGSKAEVLLFRMLNDCPLVNNGFLTKALT